MKRFLLLVLVTLAMPTASYGNEIDAFSKGHGHGVAALMCILYSTGKIEEDVLIELYSDFGVKYRKFNGFIEGWNSALSPRCKALRMPEDAASW